MTSSGYAAWIAAVTVAVTVWLSVSPVARLQRDRTRPRGAAPLLGVAGGLAVGALVGLAPGRTVVLMLVVLGGLAGAARLVRTARGRRDAGLRAQRVVDLCEALADELRAGRPPEEALRHASSEWDAIGPVASAASLGADVPTALRASAQTPGAEGLREVASAWEVSSRSGATMARALGRTAETVRLRRATQRLVVAELASAQATARLVAALPLGLLLLGSGVGGDPWMFLTGTPVGLGCLAAGVGLALLGLWWIERIADRVMSE